MRVRPVADLVRWRATGLAAWAVAGGLLAAALLVRVLLDPWLGSVAFLTFYPAIVAAALVCGWRLGVLVAVLSMLLAWHFFLAPRNSFALATSSTPVVLASFLAVALFQVALVAALAEAIRRIDAMRQLQADLFRELQHRVANNMQLIGSTLSVALRCVQDPAAREAIGQAQARVEALARLHRRLHDPETYQHGLAPVLREVLAETLRELPVTVEVDVAPRALSIDQMTAIVLLVNEAALNAAKHVFRRGLGHAFRVALRVAADGTMRLRMHDDGPGLTGSPTAATPGQHLGMAIMQSLARQLGGSLEVLEGPGLELEVTFRG